METCLRRKNCLPFYLNACYSILFYFQLFTEHISTISEMLLEHVLFTLTWKWNGYFFNLEEVNRYYNNVINVQNNFPENGKLQ